MAIGAARHLDLSTRLQLIGPFARDSHFAVREWAWLSLRPHVAANVEASVSYLVPWVTSNEPCDRRFAVELTRPRSVWGSHIPRLKERPALGLLLLEPLRCERDNYVARSVGNWIKAGAGREATVELRRGSNRQGAGCSHRGISVRTHCPEFVIELPPELGDASDRPGWPTAQGPRAPSSPSTAPGPAGACGLGH